MNQINEYRKHLPPDWSDDRILEFVGLLSEFIEGMFEFVDKFDNPPKI